MLNEQASDFTSYGMILSRFEIGALTMFVDSFWPGNVEFAIDQEIYNNQDPAGDILSYPPGSEDWREQPAEENDRSREEEWLEFFTKSSESKTSTLACTKPVETQTDGLFVHPTVG